MAKDSWLEPRSRIPFMGIVAMVLLVAIVAISLRSQAGALFPSGEVTVESASELAENRVGSASFYGEREVPLVLKERLYGSLHSNVGFRSFLVDVPGKLLLISDGQITEEVILKESPNGASLTASFEFRNTPTRVDIYPGKKYLIYTEPGKSPFKIDVALTEVISYDGAFDYRGSRYHFSFKPVGEYATITRTDVDKIKLVKQGSIYVGTWFENRKTHPVKIDLEESRAVIENIW